MGNFSRFIKLGMKRITLTRCDGRSDGQTLDGLMASSFVSPDKSKTTVVFINYGKNAFPVKIALKNIPNPGTLKLFLTYGKTETICPFREIST
jgi:hypothetical protein